MPWTSLQSASVLVRPLNDHPPFFFLSPNQFYDLFVSESTFDSGVQSGEIIDIEFCFDCLGNVLVL